MLRGSEFSQCPDRLLLQTPRAELDGPILCQPSRGSGIWAGLSGGWVWVFRVRIPHLHVIPPAAWSDVSHAARGFQALGPEPARCFVHRALQAEPGGPRVSVRERPRHPPPCPVLAALLLASSFPATSCTNPRPQQLTDAQIWFASCVFLLNISSVTVTLFFRDHLESSQRTLGKAFGFCRWRIVAIHCVWVSSVRVVPLLVHSRGWWVPVLGLDRGPG